jgi:hypothetical protein
MTGEYVRIWKEVVLVCLKAVRLEGMRETETDVSSDT